MKKTLIFEFEENENDKLNRITHTDDAYSALWDISELLRSEYKYNNDDNPDIIKYVDKLKDKIFNILHENGINFDKDYN